MKANKPRLGPKYPSVLKPARRGVYQICIHIGEGGKLTMLVYAAWTGQRWAAYGWNVDQAEHHKWAPGKTHGMAYWRGVLK